MDFVLVEKTKRGLLRSPTLGHRRRVLAHRFLAVVAPSKPAQMAPF
jgi:hypothetical protein